MGTVARPRAARHPTETVDRTAKNTRFSPIRVPVRRRLQTVAVLYHTVSIALWMSFFFLLCAVPLLWPLIAIYLVWMFLDDTPEKGPDKRQQWLRELKFWRWYTDYFPIYLHKTHELDPKRLYIFGYHPHGIITLGGFGCFGTEGAGFSKLFPGIKNTLLTLSSNFHMPLYREYLMALGIGSVSKRSCENILSRGPGHAITIVIGGAQESLLSRPHHNDLVLEKRLGVFKIALKHGADLVPIYSFGENDIYQQIPNEPGSWLYTFQQMFKKGAGFTVPLFHARGVLNYDFGLMPFRAPINTVVGKPIRVERNTNPSLEELKELQTKYIAGLKEIWDTYKDDFATEREKDLVIVE